MKRHPVRDGLNRKVPKRLEEVFYGRQILERWMDRLMVMAEQVGKELHHRVYGRDIDVRRLRLAVYEARCVIERAMPHVQCDCGSAERDCIVCGGLGWIMRSLAVTIVSVRKPLRNWLS